MRRSDFIEANFTINFGCVWMVETDISYFFIDAYTIVIDILLFLVVIFVFGNFVEYFLKKAFKIGKFCEDIPFLIRVSIKIVLGISLILVFGSVASLFSIFNQLFVLLVTVIVSAGYFLVIIRNRELCQFKWNQNLTKMLLAIVVLTLGSMTRLLTMSLNGVIFPGDDVKFHSLFIELICLNNGFCETFEPFVHQVASYPPGFHMIVAFFSMAIGQLSTKIFTVFTCFVYGLVGLGFYSLAFALSKSQVGSLVSALSVLFLNGEISLIPLWGGVTFLMALYLTSTFLALIYFDVAGFNDFFRCVAGIAFAVALVTNTGISLMGLVFLVPFLLKKILSKPVDIHAIKIHLKSAISPFVASSFGYLFLVFPLFFPAIKFILGLVPADLMTPGTRSDIYTYGADWFFLENIVSRIALNHGIFMAIVLVLSSSSFIYLLYIYSRTKSSRLRTVLFSYSTVFSWILILIIFGINNPHGVFFIQFPLWDLFIPSRIFTFLLLPLCMLSGLLFQYVFDNVKRLHACNRHCCRTCVKRLLWILVVVFLLLSLSVCYIDIEANQQTESFARQRVTISDSDLNCFKWIKENTVMDDRFLVEKGDAGQYISSFCDRTVIYPFTLMQFDSKYVDLKNNMYTDPDGTHVLNLLFELEVDYVFIGSKVDQYRNDSFAFDAVSLSAASHYKLAFNSGQSFIFEVELSSPSTYARSK